MSWSVQSVGKPAAVKLALAKQFGNAKQSTVNVPHELQSVGLIEQIVNGQLDFLADIPGLAVEVTASGSAYKHGQPVPTAGSSQVNLSVKPLYGWVE